MALGTASSNGRSRNRGSAPRVAWLVCALAALTLAAPMLGCASRGKPRKACLYFDASPSLNLYDGQSHPITVYLYPLSSSSAFEQTPVTDLIEGKMPPGGLAPPVPITLAPGEQRSFKETFPAETRQLGVLADFYRAPGDPEGTRTQVVPARCGMRKPKLILSPKDVYRK